MINDTSSNNLRFAPQEHQHSKGWAFLTWMACFVGACGVHRFYLKKPWTGLLYLLTFGLFGIGQLIDLFHLGDMVKLANLETNQLEPRSSIQYLPPYNPMAPAQEELRQRLMHEAANHGGQVSVSQGVMATGSSFTKVEETLDEMALSGFVDIDNDQHTGAVVYTFGELRS